MSGVLGVVFWASDALDLLLSTFCWEKSAARDWNGRFAWLLRRWRIRKCFPPTGPSKLCQREQKRMIGKMKRSRRVFSSLKCTWNICKQYPNANYSCILKIMNPWSQMCDYYVGCHRWPSPEKAYTGISLLIFLHHLKVAQVVHLGSLSITGETLTL